MKMFLQTRCILNEIVYPCRIAACILLAAAVAHSQPTNFITFAGYAGGGSSDGNGTSARFYNPAAVALDSATNLYIADFNNNTIRKITPSGVVTTIAGYPGIAGSTNGTGTNALFNGPQGIALDAAGNIYVADSGNNTIRAITPAGVVTTLAGYPGIGGNVNGAGTNASFNRPAALVADNSTNLYVADYGNHEIREITPAGAVTTLAGSGSAGYLDSTGTNAFFNQPEGIAIDNSGTLYVGDSGNNIIRKVTSNGGVVSTFVGTTNYGSTNASGTSAQFNSPQGVAVDSALNVYVADYLNGTIRKISLAGAVTTLAGTVGVYGSADGTGTNARFWGPQGVTVDPSGNVYVADSYNGTIRAITPAGAVTTLAGSASAGSADGQGTAARFSIPISVALDSSGNAYIADSANSTIRKVSPSGASSTLAGLAGTPGSTNGLGTNALFSGPQGTAVDTNGNVYVTDTGNHTIRKITSAGVVTTFAGYPGFTNNMDGSGTNASFYFPEGIANDSSGNLYVTDTGNSTVRKITSAGAVTTLAGLAGSYGSADGTNSAARFNGPTGIAVDASGNLYVADTFNHTIRKITVSGSCSTLAGLAGTYGSADGTNTSALFYLPQGIALDGFGNIYVADTGNNTIRKLSPSGTNWVVTTAAGFAGITGATDGAAASARFFQPAGMAFNAAGILLVADSGNNTLRSSALPFLISNLSVAARPSSAIITWNTTSNATSQVTYGLTPALGGLSAFNSTTPSTNQAVMITGLLTNTLYYFQATSTAGTNTVSTNGSFVTDDTIIIVSAQAQLSGIWTVGSAAPDRYTNFYEFASTTTGSDTADAVFRPTITAAGQYDVYIWYSEGTNRSANVPVTVSYSGGSTEAFVNQTLPGGSWQLIAGAEPFAAGTNGFIRIGNGTGESNRIVIADAVRLNYTAGQDTLNNGTVPGWWANFFFGTNVVNAALDPDGDGYSTYDEYVLGTSPTDPTSRFSMTAQPAAGGSVQVTFSPFQNGRIYQLLGASSIINPVWTNLNLPVNPDGNGNGVITVTNNGGAAFYRLSVEMAQ
jgi:sugar lactone lactonase YvrE